MRHSTNAVGSRTPWLGWGLVLAVLMSAGCGLTPEAKEARFLAAGKAELAKKDYRRAVIQFQNAARAKKGDAEPYYQLGLAYIAMGDFQTGVNSLGKAVALDPKHLQARIKIAELLASVGDQTNVQDAEALVRGVLGTAPKNADAINTLAIAEWKLGEKRNAEMDFARALDQAPQNLKASLNLARIKFYQKDFIGAEQILQKAVAASPNSAGPIVALGDLYTAEGKPDAGEQQYRRATQIDPKNDLALLNLANVYIRTNRKGLADKAYRQISDLPDRKYKPLHATFLFQDGKRDQAVTEFEKLVRDDPSDRAARTRLIEAYFAVNRLSDAQKLLTEALKANAKDADALLQRSRLYLIAGNYADAQKDVAQVLRFQADSAPAHYVMAKIHQSKKETLLYRQELSEALRLDPRMLPVRLELARSLLVTGAATAALQVLGNETPESQRHLLPVIAERNWALLVKGDMPESRKGIDEGLAQARVPDLLVQDGLWKLAQGKIPEARVVLEEDLKMNPSDLAALSALTRSYTWQRGTPMAIQKVKEYTARAPKSAPMQRFLGNLLLANGDLKQARAAFLAASAADPKFIPAYLSLAQVDFVEHKPDDARSRLQTVLGMDGKNAVALLWLGNIEESAGNHEAAIKYFRQVVETDPGNVAALNNLAYLLAEYAGRFDEALQYAQKAKELNPDGPAVEDTLGWVLYRKGLYSAALTHLEQAASQKGAVASKYHLAMAYVRSGDLDRGRATLQAALKLDPNVPEAKLAKEVLAQAK